MICRFIVSHRTCSESLADNNKKGPISIDTQGQKELKEICQYDEIQRRAKVNNTKASSVREYHVVKIWKINNKAAPSLIQTSSMNRSTWLP
jgi:hypothetical protein